MGKPQKFHNFINNDDIIASASSTSQDPPKILYHYTNSEGLKGIIESGLFYASHFLYFNDPSEINYSIQIRNVN